ncbi:GPW/gp25 family protein [Gloeobacter kilaueensis]|uniref:GPW/gp25 family protein n=1 Tax=Gloeobacter kilaueensis (strain ATCC BAA-2537 / CCAP 1431/1 / ULC 316 / JS1) TaxID=1183438 RepID=U5QJ42_GLOK1|nr:GPW/gp25 family protein [Gloeobacter kilaueensis]AGY58997.1 GPW/gp25 family protein [Gloeobacter kilaueensis JS1]
MEDSLSEKQRAYLGTGLAFPLRLNLQGGIQVSSAAQDVEEAIWIILRTGVGERVYRPNFGSRLADLAFAPLNTTTLLRIRMAVSEALEIWEPRIDLDEVLTEPDPVRGRVDIIIKYRLKGVPDPRSLVFPFYLNPQAETE